MKKVMHIVLWILSVVVAIYVLLLILSYKKYPVTYGISFNQNHAESLGLDWKKTYQAMLTDLQPKYIRIAAMWNEVEPEQGTFDFANVDFMMSEAQKHNTKVTLVVGQKTPRWPECHVPDWSPKLIKEEYEMRLLNYVETMVERYKKHPALELWQVENEPFIRFEFGDCENYRMDLVDDEIALVKRLDDAHWVMVTDSGEMGSWGKSTKAGDIFGTTVYRIVRMPNGWRWSYWWMPASAYRVRANLYGLPMERMYVSELQAEPWFTDVQPVDTPIAEQEKTMDIERLKRHIDYVERMGVSRAYLWGVEWWYWMKTVNDDSSYWDFVKEL